MASSLIEHLFVLFAWAGTLSYFVIVVAAVLNSRMKYAEQQADIISRLGPLRVLPPISVMVPAYNEEASITQSVTSMLRLNYPDLEVVCCNDGSKDQTIQRLISAFDLYEVDLRPPRVLRSNQVKAVYRSRQTPNLVVLDKVNGGKADALNACINFSSHPLICCVDADSVLDADGLMRVASRFFEDPERTIAVGGVIRIANGCQIEGGKVLATGVRWRWLELVQIPEYLRAFLIGRMGLDRLGCNTIISGAFGLFQKELVTKVGGYDPRTVGEDFELLIRMHSYCLEHKVPHRVHFEPNPVCWTEAPHDLRSLGNQRSRWTQGLAETLWSSRNMLFRPWSRQIGWVALPYLWIFEFLSAPLEVLGYFVVIGGWAFGLVQLKFVGLFLAMTMLLAMIISLAAVLVEHQTFAMYHRPRDLVKLMVGAVLEQIGFRQLHLFWRIRGIYRWLSGNKSWGAIKRQGFTPPTPGVSTPPTRAPVSSGH